MTTAISCWQNERETEGPDPESVSLGEPHFHPKGWPPNDFKFGPHNEKIISLELGSASIDLLSVSDPCIDLVGVFNLFYWHSLLFDHEIPEGQFVASSWPSYYQVYEPSFIRTAINLEESQLVRTIGICPSRLWNLVVEGSEGYISLMAVLIDISSENFQIRDNKHKLCTPQLCNFAQDNSTNIPQLHKCSDLVATRCQREVEFPLAQLDMLFASKQPDWICSAWDIRQLDEGNVQILPHSKARYIAISHVWADGTGVGIKAHGVVNHCLISFLADIAISFGCDGVWWDTICLPMEKTARRSAMDQMLENYEHASYTIIHDMELVNFEWREDGTPAIAMLLSSWFTRGWCAAELFATRRGKGRVKVIFKAPLGCTIPFVLKDLEDEVLAPDRRLRDHGCFRSLPHRVASDIIRGIHGDRYGQQLDKGYRIDDLSMLLRIIRPRTVSWAIDQMRLAAMMTLPAHEIDTFRTSPELVQDILGKMEQLPSLAVYYGEVPMATYGPWSWCPTSIFDLGKVGKSIIPNLGEQAGGYPVLGVSQLGILEGWFKVFSVDVQEVGDLAPVGVHPGVEAKIKNYLEKLVLDIPLLIMQVLHSQMPGTVAMWILGAPVRWKGSQRTMRGEEYVSRSFH